VHEGRRWVEDGHIVLSAGVSSGIDASLHVTERIWGGELAATIAKNIEYPWSPGDGG
jgi:transcriptional regulator GlxA family with amidase domain